MARTLTKQQRGFIKDYVKTGNGSAAAKKNYDVSTDLTARVIASENLTKPNIIEAVEKLQKKAGDYIPDDLLARVHLEGLKATSVRFTPEGEQIEVDDYQTRHKYLESGYSIKGSHAPTKSEALQVNLSGQIMAQNDLEALRKEYEEKLKAKLLEDKEPQ